MSYFRSTPLMRRVSVFGVAAIFAAAFAGAQSTLSSNESSSMAQQIVASDSQGGGAVPAVNGTGERAIGWKQYATHNLAFEAGAGFNGPVGNDTSTGGGGPFITWGGNVNVGAGVHLSRRISLLAEYQFIDDKLPGSFVYEVGTQGGNSHIWSFTLAPVVDLFPRRTNSIYLTGGGGFYRKVTNFTDPEPGWVCDDYDYYCGVVEGNTTVWHFSSNQGGANFGVGYSHRLRGAAGGNEKLFAEARYLFINTPSINSNNGTGTTELIPVTLGIRF